jgi:hypothetical protein
MAPLAHERKTNRKTSSNGFWLEFSIVTSRRVEGKSISMNFYDFLPYELPESSAGDDKSLGISPRAVVSGVEI